MLRNAMFFLCLLLPVEARAAEVVQSATDIRRGADAAVDRNVILPSAETLPAGIFALYDYQLVILGIGYGITDYLQVNFTTLPPVVEAHSLMLNAKLRLFRNEHIVLSIMPTFGMHFDSRNNSKGFAVGAFVDLVLDNNGNHVVSASQSVIYGHNDKEKYAGWDHDFTDFTASFTSICYNARFHEHMKRQQKRPSFPFHHLPFNITTKPCPSIDGDTDAFVPDDSASEGS